MSKINFKPANDRGFLLGKFRDSYGHHCSLQESSSGARIWLGIDSDEHGREVVAIDEHGNPVHDGTPAKNLIPCGRMHLTQADVRALLPALIHFAETGELPSTEDTE